MSSAAPSLQPVAPRRELGRWGLVAMGLSAIVGGGIYGLPATVHASIGAFGLPAYVCAGAATLLFGQAMARLGRHHDLTGGPYVYVAAAFGRFWGFQVGWFFFVTRVTTIAAVAAVFTSYLGSFWPALGAGAGRAGAMTVCLAVLALVNIIGIHRTAQAMNFFAVGKLVPLLLFILIGVTAADWSRLVPRELPALQPFGATVLQLVFAFGGFEHLTVPAEESRRPREHVPFGLFASIGTTTLLYLGVQAMASATTPELGKHAAPLADVARAIVGPPGFALMVAGAIIATVGTMLVNVLTPSRMIYAFSRDGLLPAWLGALHPRFATPVLAVLIAAGLGLLLAITGTFGRMATLSAAARLVTYGGCCAAALPLKEGTRLWPLAGLAATFVLLGFLPRQDWLLAVVTVLLGVVIYVVGRGRAPGGTLPVLRG